MSCYVYIPWQLPPLHEGVSPEQASLVPHLHTPVAVSQLSEAPEQPAFSVHFAIVIKVKIQLLENVMK